MNVMRMVGGRRLMPVLLASVFLTFSATAQMYFKQPPPGSVYKEFTRTMGGLSDWRVTDPNINLTTYPQAAPFLPNPVLPFDITDLTDATSAEVTFTVWAGHRGTVGKKVRFNGNAWIDLPNLGIVNGLASNVTVDNYVSQVCYTLDIPLAQLFVGTNHFEGTNAGQDPPGPYSWGQYGWYNMILRVYYDPAKKAHPTGSITSPTTGSSFTENPTVSATATSGAGVEHVDFFAFYDGYDTDGDGVYAEYHHDYQAMASDGLDLVLHNHVGTRTSAPYSVTWSTDWVPDQAAGSIKFLARIRDNNGVWYVTPEVTGLSLVRASTSVALYKAKNVPESYWVKEFMESASNTFTIPPSHPLAHIVAAKFLIRSWNGANADAAPPTDTRLIRINDTWTAPFFGEPYWYDFNVLDITDLSALHSGTNTVSAFVNTPHHGVEILWPGPGILAKYDVALPVQLARFTATKAAGDSVILEWTTLSETNNYGFEVQKSLHGSAAFEAVTGGFVAGNLTTLTSHTYRFVDRGTVYGDTYYRLVQIDLDGSRHPSEAVNPGIVSAVPPSAVPTTFFLDPNFPNPFNPSTTIRFGLANAGRVKLAIRSVLGEEVSVLVNEVRTAGVYVVDFDARNLTSGVYIATLESDGRSISRKMLLVK